MVDDERPPEPVMPTDEERPTAAAAGPVSADGAAPPVGPQVPQPPPAPRVAPPGYGPPGYPPPGYGYPPGVPPHWVAYVPPPPRRRSSALIALIVVLAMIFVGFILMSVAGHYLGGGGEGPGLGVDAVGVIEINGIIRDGGEGGFLTGPAGARGIMRQLRAAAKDDRVKSVLILIDSPGGSAAASAAIYKEIVRLRAKKKVVACMTDVAASGGYYVASACDQIVAEGSTLTGSIGVIFGGIGYYGLMKKFGLSDETITAGKYKAMGRGSKPMTAEEKAIVVAMLSNIYEQFLQAVADGRKGKLTIAQVRKLAEGRVYTGAQAKDAGLIDQLGNYYDAIELAAKLGGIRGEPRLKHYGAGKGLLEELTGTEGRLQQAQRAPSPVTEIPLDGPMLLLPYVYRVEPVLHISP